MYTKLKESVFYQSRAKKCKAELEENGKDIKKKTSDGSTFMS